MRSLTFGVLLASILEGVYQPAALKNGGQAAASFTVQECGVESHVEKLGENVCMRSVGVLHLGRYNCCRTDAVTRMW